jgi:hypothetical protein
MYRNTAFDIANFYSENAINGLVNSAQLISIEWQYCKCARHPLFILFLFLDGSVRGVTWYDESFVNL